MCPVSYYLLMAGLWVFDIVIAGMDIKVECALNLITVRRNEGFGGL